MFVEGVEIDLNIEQYLREHEIEYWLIKDNAMILCPFHTETRPGFGINLKTGLYHCFGCGARGNIVSFIRKVEELSSYTEALSLLISKYGIYTNEEVSAPNLAFGKKVAAVGIQYIDEETLRQWDFRHPYLETRGISEIWQKRFRIGYDQESNAITIPWHDRFGQCVGVKFRSVTGKRFWVLKTGELAPNDVTLWGINHVVRRRDTVIAITEAEIDALYAWQILPTLAVGTSHISEAQVRELANTNVDTVIIATDNDAAGRDLAASLQSKLVWIPNLRPVDWSLFPDKKDLNSLTQVQLSTLLTKR